jgi:CheY-like chemotaxis protein
VPENSRTRPRILIAGTREAIETLSALLEGHADVVAARSTPEALGHFDAGRFDTVACSVRFDESRMFDFLQALHERPAGRRARIVCFRVAADQLTPSTRAAIAQALEALGVPVFLDMPQLAARHGPEVAQEILRQIVIGPGDLEQP